MKMKVLSDIKNLFDWNSRYSLESPKDDDKPDENWSADIENRRAAFNQIYEHLLGLRQSSLEKSDELIIALSSTFLALSIGFIKEIVPLERSILMPILVVSWICLFAATSVNFFSHSVARHAIENQIECARLYIPRRLQQIREARKQSSDARDRELQSLGRQSSRPGPRSHPYFRVRERVARAVLPDHQGRRANPGFNPCFNPALMVAPVREKRGALMLPQPKLKLEPKATFKLTPHAQIN